MKAAILAVLLMPILSFAGQQPDSHPAEIKLNQSLKVDRAEGSGFSYIPPRIFLGQPGDIENSCNIDIFAQAAETLDKGTIISGTLTRVDQPHILQHDRGVHFYSIHSENVQVQFNCATSGTFSADQLTIADLNKILKEYLVIKEL